MKEIIYILESYGMLYYSSNSCNLCGSNWMGFSCGTYQKVKHMDITGGVKTFQVRVKTPLEGMYDNLKADIREIVDEIEDE